MIAIIIGIAKKYYFFAFAKYFEFNIKIVKIQSLHFIELAY